MKMLRMLKAKKIFMQEDDLGPHWFLFPPSRPPMTENRKFRCYFYARRIRTPCIAAVNKITVGDNAALGMRRAAGLFCPVAL